MTVLLPKDFPELPSQERVRNWVREVIGSAAARNAPERSLRAAEEVIELVQACGVQAETVHRLVDYVFERPVGEPSQEIAGSFVALYAVAAALGVDAEAALQRELGRIHTREVVERVRRRQSEKREALGRPAAPVTPPEGPAAEAALRARVTALQEDACAVARQAALLFRTSGWVLTDAEPPPVDLRVLGADYVGGDPEWYMLQSNGKWLHWLPNGSLAESRHFPSLWFAPPPVLPPEEPSP